MAFCITWQLRTFSSSIDVIYFYLVPSLNFSVIFEKAYIEPMPPSKAITQNRVLLPSGNSVIIIRIMIITESKYNAPLTNPMAPS